MSRLLLLLWERWFGTPLRQVEAASLAYRLSPASAGPDWKTVLVVLTAAGCLTLQNYTGHPDRIGWLVGGLAEFVAGTDGRAAVLATLDDWGGRQGPRLCWYGLMTFMTYAAIPALVITFVFRQRLTDFGAGTRGVAADWPVYVAFGVVMLPLVWAFSGVERFQATYPFYRIRSPAEIGPDFFRWELVYALQFIGLEFFFRGFIVHGTKHRFGVYSVFVMVIPYCMIHFHKPIPETIGSIIAGVALGVVSLVTRSVWPGAALHILVAWGMDASCLVRRGMIF